MNTQTQTLGTYGAYVQARKGTLVNDEQIQAFGRDVYQIVVQIVMGNEFSLPAQLNFPRIRDDWSLLSLINWAARLKSWFNDLTSSEQKMFRDARFLWE